MKNALIVGATGTIGSSVSEAFKNAGYEVIAVSRHSGEKNIDIEISESVKEFFAQQASYDVIICAAGSAAFGALEKLGESDFNSSLNSKLMGQIRLVKYGMPKLKAKGAIILTGGIFAFDPWPETSALATVNAGLDGFVRAAALETKDDKKICIVHPPFIAESAEKLGMDPTPWPGADAAAATYLKAVLNGKNGKALYMVGFSPEDYLTE